MIVVYVLPPAMKGWSIGHSTGARKVVLPVCLKSPKRRSSICRNIAAVLIRYVTPTNGVWHMGAKR
ncbi:hypothetical protein D3C72_2474090 [compost metagenome]